MFLANRDIVMLAVYPFLVLKKSATNIMKTRLNENLSGYLINNITIMI